MGLGLHNKIHSSDHFYINLEVRDNSCTLIHFY